MKYAKFENKKITAKNETRAWVTLDSLQTLWFNTGTKCNLSCKNCYIESSPTNNRLVYLNTDDIWPYLEEIKHDGHPTSLIGLTGGEPFLNPSIIEMISLILSYNHDVLILTNAFRVLERHKDSLLALKEKYASKLHIRVSLDHYTKERHEEERGPKSFEGALEGLKWLSENAFNISIAGRNLLDETVADALSGYQRLLEKIEIPLELKLNENMTIFPEMIMQEDVPEITTACWDILSKKPSQQMCATERMIVKREGEMSPVVLPCTLIAYDKSFELGTSLKESEKDVYLNHPFCSKFCVLGGASCSSAK